MAVVCGGPHGWAEAVERVLAPLAVEVAARVETVAQALLAVDEQAADLLILLAGDESVSDDVALVHERRPALEVVAFVPSSAGVSAALGAGAVAAIVPRADADRA